MFVFGVVSYKLMKKGKIEKVRKIINKIYVNLGLYG